ncbi:RmlC-like cupin domain-containing protein [Zopfochytrium polystomum]|nr:RmlC-like cupin domain-containing protein [Zopfochytrium polystomum]
MALSLITNRGKLSVPAPFEVQNPFLFCVYHKDLYPAGNERMEAPKRGNGADFNPNAPYRMYHGDRIPGFPQHPHRGFETFTCTMEGLIDHTDSLGCSGRYGNGDAQWMTAGRGIVHGENFPLINMDKPNPARLFQIWLNLPKKSKMVPPAQVMHWHEEIPKHTSPDGKVTVTIWAGELEGKRALSPNPNSWAADPENDVHVFHIRMQPGGTITLPAARSGSNRSFYVVEGPSRRGAVMIAEEPVPMMSFVSVSPEEPILIEFNGVETDSSVEILMLQGKPIDEPVVQYGPFVMSTEAEIRQAFSDYRSTQFGGWPWEEDAVVFSRDTGRFLNVSKQTTLPPTASA